MDVLCFPVDRVHQKWNCSYFTTLKQPPKSLSWPYKTQESWLLDWRTSPFFLQTVLSGRYGKHQQMHQMHYQDKPQGPTKREQSQRPLVPEYPRSALILDKKPIDRQRHQSWPRPPWNTYPCALRTIADPSRWGTSTTWKETVEKQRWETSHPATDHPLPYSKQLNFRPATPWVLGYTPDTHPQ